MSADSLFAIENEAFAGFMFYGTLLIVKVLLMGPLTSLYRIWNSSVPTPEDKMFCIFRSAKSRKKVTDPSESVERVRRAHRNDLENCFAFVFVALFYLATGPDAATAILHFKIFFYARLLHSVVYVIGLQPGRAICWFIGMGATISMIYRTVTAF